MIRIRIKITATTNNMWINPPKTWNPIKPKTQRTNKIIAIIVSI